MPVFYAGGRAGGRGTWLTLRIGFAFRRWRVAGYNPAMSADRKKSLWPWIAALLIGLPVLYVASFGPACWIVAHHGGHSSLFDHVYWPIGWCSDERPSTVLSVVKWYAMIGSPRASKIRLPCNSEMDSGLLISESSVGRFIE